MLPHFTEWRQVQFEVFFTTLGALRVYKAMSIWAFAAPHQLTSGYAYHKWRVNISASLADNWSWLFVFIHNPQIGSRNGGSGSIN